MILTVKTSKSSYDILIENSVFNRIGEIIGSVVKNNAVYVVTDRNVDSIYGEKFKNHLKDNNVKFTYKVLPDGERTKSLEILFEMYSELARANITRKDYVIAFGGGVIGDLSGFLAATYLRGVGLIQIPTTLLAQVDSSVGGKTAVDLPEGKNLVGSFYPPQKVIIDPEFIKTLPERVLNDGMAEVIKYGCIRDEKLFSLLEENKMEDIAEEVISICVGIKKDVVENDEFDTGERMILNFGHTYGHVVESAYNYESYTHGEGVAIGMLRITEKTEEMGVTEKGTTDRLAKLLKKNGLLFDGVKIEKEKARKILNLDKKSSGNVIKYAVITKIGNCEIMPMDKKDDFLIS